MFRFGYSSNNFNEFDNDCVAKFAPQKYSILVFEFKSSKYCISP